MLFCMKYPQAWRGFEYAVSGIIVSFGGGGKKVLASMRPFLEFLFAVVSFPLGVQLQTTKVHIFDNS